jgi:rubrerythrin
MKAETTTALIKLAQAADAQQLVLCPNPADEADATETAFCNSCGLYYPAEPESEEGCPTCGIGYYLQGFSAMEQVW